MHLIKPNKTSEVKVERWAGGWGGGGSGGKGSQCETKCGGGGGGGFSVPDIEVLLFH